MSCSMLSFSETTLFTTEMFNPDSAVFRSSKINFLALKFVESALTLTLTALILPRLNENMKMKFDSQRTRRNPVQLSWKMSLIFSTVYFTGIFTKSLQKLENKPKNSNAYQIELLSAKTI